MVKLNSNITNFINAGQDAVVHESDESTDGDEVIDTTVTYESNDNIESSVIGEGEESQTSEKKTKTLSLNKPSISEDVENRARKLGWVPKEEFRGDVNLWRDADTWIQGGKKPDSYKKHIDRLEEKLEKLTDIILKNQTKSLDVELNELKNKKIEAIRAGDVELVEKIEKVTDSLREEQVKYSKPTVNQTIPEEIENFAQRNNEWFNDRTPRNSRMKQFAIDIENEYSKKFPDLSLEERLVEVEQAVYEKYNPNMMNNAGNTTNHARNAENRQYAAQKTTQSVPKNKNLPLFEQLDGAMQTVIDHYVERSKRAHNDSKGKTVLLTREKYIKQLRDDGVI